MVEEKEVEEEMEEEEEGAWGGEAVCDGRRQEMRRHWRYFGSPGRRFRWRPMEARPQRPSCRGCCHSPPETVKKGVEMVRERMEVVMREEDVTQPHGRP